MGSRPRTPGAQQESLEPPTGRANPCFRGSPKWAELAEFRERYYGSSRRHTLEAMSPFAVSHSSGSGDLGRRRISRGMERRRRSFRPIYREQLAQALQRHCRRDDPHVGEIQVARSSASKSEARSRTPQSAVIRCQTALIFRPRVRRFLLAPSTERE